MQYQDMETQAAPLFTPASTLADVWAAWAITADHHLHAKDTRYAYRLAFARFESLHATKLMDIDTDDLQRVMDASGLSYSQQRQTRSAMKALFDFAIANGAERGNPAALMKLPQRPTKNWNTFTMEEVDRAFDKLSVRDMDIFCVLVYTGLRLSELTSLAKTSVRWDDMTICVKPQVGRSATRTIHIHPRIEPLLRARYAKTRARLFNNAEGGMFDAKRFMQFEWPRLMGAIGVDPRKKSTREAARTAAALGIAK